MIHAYRESLWLLWALTSSSHIQLWYQTRPPVWGSKEQLHTLFTDLQWAAHTLHNSLTQMSLLDLNGCKFPTQMLFDRGFFSPLHILKMALLSKKASHSFSSNTFKKKKRNLNRAVEIKFSVLKYFLVLRNLHFTLIFHQILSYHEKKAFDNLPSLRFKKHILTMETGGQAWLLHHRHFNQYLPEHFRKKTLELKSISLLKKKSGCKTTKTAGKSCNVPRTWWSKITLYERKGGTGTQLFSD